MIRLQKFGFPNTPDEFVQISEDFASFKFKQMLTALKVKQTKGINIDGNPPADIIWDTLLLMSTQKEFNFLTTTTRTGESI